ncbi:hypothetical protein LCGC14_2790280, partial [marine sediment metagenome]
MDSVDLDRRLAKLEWERDFDQRLRNLEGVSTADRMMALERKWSSEFERALLEARRLDALREKPVLEAARAVVGSYQAHGFRRLQLAMERLV